MFDMAQPPGFPEQARAVNVADASHLRTGMGHPLERMAPHSHPLQTDSCAFPPRPTSMGRRSVRQDRGIH
jgi:hypothetical protein